MDPNEYPEAVAREMRRLAVEWKRAAPANDAPLSVPGPDGKPQEDDCATTLASPPLLEQLAEYHGRMARRRLRRYAEEPSRRLAAKIAEHVMFANLARAFFNQKMGQPARTDLPFTLA
jgi:hypothetical protein